MSNKNDESRRTFIQVSLNDKEKQKIKDLAEDRHTSMSDFCRVAIFDYVRKLENPELFQGNMALNQNIIEQIIHEQKKNHEIQELILEGIKTMNGMKETLELIKTHSIKPDNAQKETVVSLFTVYKALTPIDIIEKTNLNKEIVFSIIAELHNEGKIELTESGKWRIK